VISVRSLWEETIWLVDLEVSSPRMFFAVAISTRYGVGSVSAMIEQQKFGVGKQDDSSEIGWPSSNPEPAQDRQPK